MVHTYEEALALEKAVRRTGVVLRVGNKGHNMTHRPYLAKCLKDGVIGDVTEVFSFSDRPNTMLHRPKSCPVPPGMDWELWCGGSPVCEPYGGEDGRVGLHPHDWHSWIDYGNGSIGNMGTHVLDAPYQAMDMWKVAPSKVVVKDVAWGCEGAWNKRAAFDFSIPLVKTLMLSNMLVFAGKGTHGIEGDRTTSAVANAHAKMTYRTGWNPLA